MDPLRATRGRFFGCVVPLIGNTRLLNMAWRTFFFKCVVDTVIFELIFGWGKIQNQGCAFFQDFILEKGPLLQQSFRNNVFWIPYQK